MKRLMGSTTAAERRRLKGMPVKRLGFTPMPAETLETKAKFAAKCLSEGRAVLLSDDAVLAMAHFIHYGKRGKPK